MDFEYDCRTKASVMGITMDEFVCTKADALDKLIAKHEHYSPKNDDPEDYIKLGCAYFVEQPLAGTVPPMQQGVPSSIKELRTHPK